MLGAERLFGHTNTFPPCKDRGRKATVFMYVRQPGHVGFSITYIKIHAKQIFDSITLCICWSYADGKAFLAEKEGDKTGQKWLIYDPIIAAYSLEKALKSPVRQKWLLCQFWPTFSYGCQDY